LVATDPQDGCGLADGEHLGQPLQHADWILGCSGGGRRLGLEGRLVA
jgi:hypothetical protein